MPPKLRNRPSGVLSDAEIYAFLNQQFDKRMIFEKRALIQSLGLWLRTKERTITQSRPEPSGRGTGRCRRGGRNLRGRRGNHGSGNTNERGERSGEGDEDGSGGNSDDTDGSETESEEEGNTDPHKPTTGGSPEEDNSHEIEDSADPGEPATGESPGEDHSHTQGPDGATQEARAGDEEGEGQAGDGDRAVSDGTWSRENTQGTSDSADQEESATGRGPEEDHSLDTGDIADLNEPSIGGSQEEESSRTQGPGRDTQQPRMEGEENGTDGGGGTQREQRPEHGRMQQLQATVEDEEEEGTVEGRAIRREQRQDSGRMQQLSQLLKSGRLQSQDRQAQTKEQYQERIPPSEQAHDAFTPRSKNEETRVQNPPLAEEEFPGPVYTENMNGQQGLRPNSSPPLDVVDDYHFDPSTPNRAIANSSRFTGPIRTPQTHPHPKHLGFAGLSPADTKRVNDPLRLTADLIDKAAFERVKSRVFNLPNISKLDPPKHETVHRFIDSLFCPERYWDLRNTMAKVISRKGGYERKRVNNDESQTGDELPSSVKIFVTKWHMTGQFALETATKDLSKMISMGREMHCYESWCRLLATWNPHRGEDDGVLDGIGGFAISNTCDLRHEEPVDSKATGELNEFVKNELERRQGEPKLMRCINGNPKHSSVLKSVMAPHLGFSTSIDTDGYDEDRPTVDFDKAWNNTMTRGKTVYVLHHYLGWGALTVVRSTHLIVLGGSVQVILAELGEECCSSLKSLFEILYDVFLLPVTSGKGLVREEVDRFIQLNSKKQLVEECSRHPEGLRGMFKSKRKGAEVDTEELGGGARVDIEDTERGGGEGVSSDDVS
ncbi:MAG: hypothetical protein Q9225_007893, partial [Loekoesia sp. 1 TL-2023]